MRYAARRTGPVTIVDLGGRLSLGEARAFGPGSDVVLGDVIRKLVQKGEQKILLNLSEVTYMDSSGIGQLVSAFTTVRKQGGEPKLANLTAPVRELLQATHLHTVLDIKDNEASALQSFSPGAAAAR